jgi:uncharacterized protein YggE
MTGKHFVLALGAVVLALACGGIYMSVRPDNAHGGSPPVQSITVTGTGVVTVTPDRADFSFGVHAQRPTAKGAVAAAAVRMRNLINALNGAGIQSRDVQTQGVSVSAAYTNNILDGYTASNSVVVKVRDIDKAGAVIDVAVDAGATSVWGPSMFRSDRQAQGRNAIRAAVNDARAKAQSAAAASGATIGRLIGVIESGAVPASSGTTGGTTTGSTGIASMPTPVQPGEQSVEVTVSATFTAQ